LGDLSVIEESYKELYNTSAKEEHHLYKNADGFISS
jgi:hypothetical protein